LLLLRTGSPEVFGAIVVPREARALDCCSYNDDAMNTPSLSLDDALTVLSEHAADADGTTAWPEASWDALRCAGVPAWTVPTAYGGAELGPLELLAGYRQLAGACLTTCFLLSQRDAAVRRIRDSGNEELRRKLLPPLARGESFATVGLSQLTTSRQHTRPALVGRLEGGRLELDGVMPWVTGAARANHFVTGAALDDGRQVLLAVPRDVPGLTIAEPMQLAALDGSLTTEVRCEAAAVDRSWMLAGPAEQVMSVGRGGTGGLETSALALGLAAAAAGYLRHEAVKRPEWLASAEACTESGNVLWHRLLQLARDGCSPAETADLRAQANTLVLRATQLALAAAKGAGFLRAHPAQLWARQALFFLVWSCPRPALEGTLNYLQPVCED
jgi:alkylation response protein AidB-like acyl-CoA dehydrogenase